MSRGKTWLRLVKRIQAPFSKECTRLLRMLPGAREHVGSLLLLLLAALGLCWTQYMSKMKPARTSIVHLFEWRWMDVALECERFLGPNGFAGVQVSPPNENLIIMNPWRPWWERYQPISYKLCSRSGSENEFRDMVTRCNDVGVHIYVDAVINHMCSSGAGSGYRGICGSYFDAGLRDFPAVPYSSFDFNDRICKTPSGDIENYSDPIQVRDCRLASLVDLTQRREEVRSKIAAYMNHLIEIGVAGFRIDASKHIWPMDINAILRKVNNLNTRWFAKGVRPFIYQEVIDLGGEAVQSHEYFRNGHVTEFKYGAQLGTVLRKWNGEKMANLKGWGEDWSLMPTDKALVFVDNHDNQRGHGAGGASILTFWDPRLYKMAVAFMLAHPYGFTRIMSSYRWPRDIQNGKDLNDWVGPPSYSDGSIKPVTTNPDGTCGNGWVCEHRWHPIRNMVTFRNVVFGQPMTSWWDNNNHQVAFGRNGKGFIVFNNEDRNLLEILQTGLPPGIYCDVISGEKEGNLCTGIQVHVFGNGSAHFQINSQAEDPLIAIHVEAKL
ncbi:pancreatic alpha-amylase-like [Varanus komodoensis]|nr:pancreatic alpha-amylase-like [Varanus komodoensis]XP_044288530.1 pancreatic alpha-amylase-like [Varanus komodoensis]